MLCSQIKCPHSDVNECDSSNGGCDQICINNDGSFECSCNPGFELASDGFSCDSKYATPRGDLAMANFIIQPSDLNECLDNNGGCAQMCTNIDGSAVCFCNAGFVLASDNLNCDGKSTSPSQCCALR